MRMAVLIPKSLQDLLAVLAVGLVSRDDLTIIKLDRRKIQN